MKKKDIQVFIEKMLEIGDEWTDEQVKDVYGNKTLEDALIERKKEVGMFLSTLGNAFLGKRDKD